MTSEVCGTCRYFDADADCCHLRLMPVNRTSRACPEWETVGQYLRRVAFTTLVVVGIVCACVSFATAAVVR